MQSSRSIMHMLITLCLLTLQHVTPHSCRTINAVQDNSEIYPENSNEVAKFLIPLLERSLDTADLAKHHKKLLPAVNIESPKDHPRKAWRNLKTNKKHLVEITPLRHRGIRTKPLAYIFSAAKHPKHNAGEYDPQSVSREESNESFESLELKPKTRIMADDENVHSKLISEEVSRETDDDSVDITVDNHRDSLKKLSPESGTHSHTEHVGTDAPPKYHNHHADPVDYDNNIVSVENDAKNKDISKESENISDNEPFGPGDHVIYRKSSIETGENYSYEKTDKVSDSHDVKHHIEDVSTEGNNFDLNIKVSEENLLNTEPDNYEASHEINEYNIPEENSLLYTFGRGNSKGISEEENGENPDAQKQIKDGISSVGHRVKCQVSTSKKLVVSNNSNEFGEGEKDSKFDCNETEKDGVASKVLSNQNFRGAAKSYRLSFLFNK